MAVTTAHVSCPVCGTTVHLYALNLDAEGNRVEDPHQRRYGLFYKTRTIGGRGHLVWTTQDMPVQMARAVRAQLLAGLATVDAYLAACDPE